MITIRCTRSLGPRGFFCLQVFRRGPVNVDGMRAYSEFHMNDKEQCHQVVLDFCVAINNWGDTFTTVKRIANGQFVSEARRIAVNGQTVESCLLEHAQIFQAFVVPRERKFGTNPGQPNSWSRSTFFDVSASGITAVAFPAKRRCEVSTEWGYLLPSGQTKFVLKLNAGRWLIDSLKSRHTSSDTWRVMHI